MSEMASFQSETVHCGFSLTCKNTVAAVPSALGLNMTRSVFFSEKNSMAVSKDSRSREEISSE